MLLIPHDQKIGFNIRRKKLGPAANCLGVLSLAVPSFLRLLQDLPLPLVTSCIYWQSSFFRRLAKASPVLVGRIEPHHFHFSGKALQWTIIPGQSDITLVAGFFATPDRFQILSTFSSELNGALFSASFLCQYILHSNDNKHNDNEDNDNEDNNTDHDHIARI